jgi:hypothetical protein
MYSLHQIVAAAHGPAARILRASAHLARIFDEK